MSLLAVTGCGFQVAPGTSLEGDAAPVADAAVIIDVAVDAISPDAPVLVDARPPHVCGPAYVPLAASGTLSTYKKYNVGNGWTAAKATCESETAYLVIPETTAEAKAVYTLIAPQSDSPFYFVGILKSGTGLVDVLGRPFLNPPWADDQPSAGANQPAILVDMLGEFYDYFTDAPQEFACECAPN